MTQPHPILSLPSSGSTFWYPTRKENRILFTAARILEVGTLGNHLAAVDRNNIWGPTKSQWARKENETR